MNSLIIVLFVKLLFYRRVVTHSEDCKIICPLDNNQDVQCAFDLSNNSYKMFSSKCAMAAYSECHKIEFVQTPLKYCIKSETDTRRSMYGESCPVFCPSHYRPVCAAKRYRSYIYRSFNNGCYLDMLNCRGDEDSSYVEVPLEFCQNHLMKNIFSEKVVAGQYRDYQDYNLL